MARPAILALQDGSWFEGESFGAEVDSFGEVVFNTSMTGYQEILTDPSYAGQIVIPTYPIIGNYGVNGEHMESRAIRVAGFAVREHCLEPSHNLSNMTVHEYLASQGIAGIAGIDTRAVTRKLRFAGVMMGMIAVEASPEEALERLRSAPRYDEVDFVAGVSAEKPYGWEDSSVEQGGPLVLVSDYGLKYNILRLLRSRGCRVMAMPVESKAADILALQPDGIVLSPGPGDPAMLDYVVETARALIGQAPILGICLGHQVIARALGGSTFKLKFGHRGGNHPVRDISTGRVHITAQNHGYAVDGDSLPPELEVSHVNLNDGTVEGMRHRELPVMSIQYHSEASPGPLDNVYLFDRFMDMVVKKDL
ncbi:MAG: glutamine-hydrolyzing carbamoyl-phosphate synthase small subunit [Chloroflexota bacterium]|nr:glutamine-hydrolyzing carbamoyl-phosphate synthase small subunit [Chloroflexota bacterium]MDE2941436.1 glutamine-hydrolyzing carbamoyl-phosphate synthase small subunit [Chloroflexota bacterium]MDE3267646.1 glutamine-hydrolyzing carbamoyl-phosphate synthase small subunit [Chloroflexota bacterium]